MQGKFENNVQTICHNTVANQDKHYFPCLIADFLNQPWPYSRICTTIAYKTIISRYCVLKSHLVATMIFGGAFILNYGNLQMHLFKLGHVHSPREIISTAGKTGHDARWKRKQS